jgi:hypothetical protein
LFLVRELMSLKVFRTHFSKVSQIGSTVMRNDVAALRSGFCGQK